MARRDSSTTDSDSDSSDDHRRRRRRRHHRHSRRDAGGKAEKSERDRKEKEKSRKKKHKSSREEERRRRRKRRRQSSSRRRQSSSDSDSSSSSSSSERDSDAGGSPGLEGAVRDILVEFPNSIDELPELLKMVDDGQAIDTRQISDQSMSKRLKKLFRELALEEQDGGVFWMDLAAVPTLQRVGHFIKAHPPPGGSRIEAGPPSLSVGNNEVAEQQPRGEAPAADNPSTSGKKRVIGPEMPSAELLAAAAKLTEAETELRDAELDMDDGLFIGPPPPALVAEAASANEAERFEEVSRIMGAEADSAYDVLGVNHKMSMENIKKKYWKLSLLVHPDKCSHPLAHQAFVILNKSFKELQDPEKKKITDDKIKRKEEQEAMEVELRALREAAVWRKSQGISMEGDDILLAEPEPEQQPPQREEWMTALPQERKPGISMHSVTSFSRTGNEGRGDTSAWTDTPLDKAQKAKTNYLEAYNKTKELAAAEDNKRSTDAELVDQYNKSKRSVPLVQKVEEEANRRKKKKVKKSEKEEWSGQHPWKPWDREKDLVAGRQKVDFDSNSMATGLSSRFSSGNFQRNFL